VTSYHHHHHHGYYYPFPYLVYEYYDGPHHDCHHHGHHYHDEGGYIHIGIGF